MGFKNPTKAKNLTTAYDIFMAIPDEMLGALVAKSLKKGCSIQIGQTRNRNALTIRFYEPGETPTTQYCNSHEEASNLAVELLAYIESMPER